MTQGGFSPSQDPLATHLVNSKPSWWLQGKARPANIHLPATVQGERPLTASTGHTSPQQEEARGKKPWMAVPQRQSNTEARVVSSHGERSRARGQVGPPSHPGLVFGNVLTSTFRMTPRTSLRRNKLAW